jgi:hypothetical protein
VGHALSHVATQHPRSIAHLLLNACFVSDAEHPGVDRAQWWIHGQTHDSLEHVLNGTRVICNPRGPAKAGVNENARFDLSDGP